MQTWSRLASPGLRPGHSNIFLLAGTSSSRRSPQQHWQREAGSAIHPHSTWQASSLAEAEKKGSCRQHRARVTQEVGFSGTGEASGKTEVCGRTQMCILQRHIRQAAMYQGSLALLHTVSVHEGKSTHTHRGPLQLTSCCENSYTATETQDTTAHKDTQIAHRQTLCCLSQCSPHRMCMVSVHRLTPKPHRSALLPTVHVKTS